jgi:hypothetical protein
VSVSFTTAAALVHELIEARDEKRLLRLQRQLASHKLLIIDELGYVPLSQTGAELLFEVFSQRYERGATIVTTPARCSNFAPALTLKRERHAECEDWFTDDFDPTVVDLNWLTNQVDALAKRWSRKPAAKRARAR